MPGRLIYMLVTLVIWKWNLIFITSQENVALNKQAYQSSTWEENGVSWQAQNAVNGDKSCDIVDGRHYSATHSYDYPWWKVDLRQLCNISKVNVFGQKNDNNDQLSGFQVYLTSDDPDPSHLDSSSLVYNATSYDTNGTFSIPTSYVARYCLIRRPVINTPIVLCEVEVFGTEFDLIKRIKAKVTTAMSSNLTYAAETTSWYSENAIDGRYSGDPNTCGGCCSGTAGTEAPWWQIDLGMRYLVETIKIYGRPDAGNRHQSSDLWIFVGDATMELINGSLVSHVSNGNETYGAYSYTLALSPARLFRFLIVRKVQTGVMTICEVQLFESKCSQITFGNNCSETCHCANNQSCYHTDGNIFCDNCAPGWIENSCSTCAVGTFGEKCASTCSDHCLSGKSHCSSVTGHCDQGCEKGYTGPKCDSECAFGTFGANCSKKCGHCKNNSSCDHVNGLCWDGCAPGYVSGDRLCNTECSASFFGNGCSQRCYCRGGTNCDHVTGQCEVGECDTGWQGNSCNTHCKYPTFGNGCNYTCHCAECDPVNGTCLALQCDVGWKGPSCSEDTNIITFTKGNVSTSMSSVYNGTWESNLAIDGNFGPDPLLCICCARTNNEAISWWSVDLRQKYPISLIMLFGRNEVPDIGQQLEGFQIILSNTSLFDQKIFYKDNFSHIATSYTVEVNNQLARFIKIQRPGVLTLCEVSIMEGECATGYFGTECSSECKCLDNKPCSRSNGLCSSPFCQLGWRGIACDSECLPGTFGLNCREQCFCINGENCSKEYGICPGACKPGYQAPQCYKEIVFDQDENTDSPATTSKTTNLLLTGIIGISVAAAIFVASLASFIVFKIYRRHIKNRAEDNNTYMQPNQNSLAPDLGYDSLEAPQGEYINMEMARYQHCEAQTF